MNEYLNQHRHQKDSNQVITHTRIPDKTQNIYGGSFYMPDKEEFWKTYFSEIVKKQKEEYLTEKQDLNGVLAIDLDFRYNTETKTRQHNNQDLLDNVLSIVEPLKQFYKFNDDTTFKVFVM
jgi:Holliday junction resolvase RusA-like endonuclease